MFHKTASKETLIKSQERSRTREAHEYVSCFHQCVVEQSPVFAITRFWQCVSDVQYKKEFFFPEYIEFFKRNETFGSDMFGIQPRRKKR